jgi:hypothetical protein
MHERPRAAWCPAAFRCVPPRGALRSAHTHGPVVAIEALWSPLLVAIEALWSPLLVAIGALWSP